LAYLLIQAPTPKLIALVRAFDTRRKPQQIPRLWKSGG
jgi:hypothetical protein